MKDSYSFLNFFFKTFLYLFKLNFEGSSLNFAICSKISFSSFDNKLSEFSCIIFSILFNLENINTYEISSASSFSSEI